MIATNGFLGLKSPCIILVVILFVISIFLTPPSHTHNNGFVVHGIPMGVNKLSNWNERTALVLINQARMAPKGYTQMNRFSTVLSENAMATLVPVPPVYESRSLQEAARNHSNDMAVNNCFQHSSCQPKLLGNANWENRVKQFHTENGMLGENIGFGFNTAHEMVTAWFESNTHRINLLEKKYNVAGVGFRNRRWTVNFASTETEVKNPIVAGSHLIQNSGNITFLANYFDRSEDSAKTGPVSANVVINIHIKQPLKLNHSYKYEGSVDSKMGTYIYEERQINDCRRYHFEFKRPDGTVIRYPERGELVTFGEGNKCREDHILPTV